MTRRSGSEESQYPFRADPPTLAAHTDSVVKLAGPGYPETMSREAWRDAVAAQLGEAARGLTERHDHRVRKALGTCLAYLEKAASRGDPLASDLMRHLRAASAVEQPTERFQFAPGELEEIKSRRGG
jgi:hypothetical protein